MLVNCQNKKQNNQIFSEIISSRWQEENNRLLFSVTGIDDQGLSSCCLASFYNHLLSFLTHCKNVQLNWQQCWCSIFTVHVAVVNHCGSVDNNLARFSKDSPNAALLLANITRSSKPECGFFVQNSIKEDNFIRGRFPQKFIFL